MTDPTCCSDAHLDINPSLPGLCVLLHYFFRDASSFSTLDTSPGMEEIIRTRFELTNSSLVGYEIIHFPNVRGTWYKSSLFRRMLVA